MKANNANSQSGSIQMKLITAQSFKKSTYTLSFVLLFLIASFSAQAQCPQLPSQWHALGAIADANPGNSSGWTTADCDYCNWLGVTCDVNGQVTELDLSSRDLTNLPIDIGELVYLTSLELDNNYLTSLPTKIGQLVNLTTLNLYNNQLTSIPAKIGQLVNLSKLYLFNNQLTYLPAEIGQLSSLNFLYLNSNQITDLPIEIGQLANLNILWLNNNQLTDLPPEIGQLSNLNTLQVFGNQLTSIPDRIGALVNLTSLWLHNNQLTDIPMEIGYLANLTSLYLNNNQLTSIPAEIGQLSNLNTLNLQYNQLMDLPTEIGQLSSLTRLWLYNNQITSLPAQIGNLSSLTSFRLNNNELSCLPIEMQNLCNNLTPVLNNNQLPSAFTWAGFCAIGFGVCCQTIFPTGSPIVDSDCDGIGDGCDVCDGGDDTVDVNADGLPDCAYPPLFTDNIVDDWKCGRNKLYVCIGNSGNIPNIGITMCATKSQAYATIANNSDAYLGPCDNAQCISIRSDDETNNTRPNVNSGNKFEVYPNPAKDLVQIELYEMAGSSGLLNITNRIGQLIYSNTYTKIPTAPVNVDLTDFSAGIYFVSIIKADGTKLTKKLVVTK